MGDANYGFWMMLPFTVTQAAILRLRPDQSDPKAWTAIAACASAALAFKHNAVTLALAVGLGVTSRSSNPAPKSVTSWPARSADRALGRTGLALAAVASCLAAPYVFSGRALELAALARSQLRYSAEYLSGAPSSFGGIITRVLEDIGCIMSYAPGVFVLAALGLFGSWRERMPRATWIRVAIVAFSAFAALSLTLRFYHHDLVMIWPPRCSCSSKPRPTSRAFDESPDFVQRNRPHRTASNSRAFGFRLELVANSRDPPLSTRPGCPRCTDLPRVRAQAGERRRDLGLGLERVERLRTLRSLRSGTALQGASASSRLSIPTPAPTTTARQ